MELKFFLLQIAFFLHFLFRHFTFPDLFLSKFIDSRYLFLHLFFCRDFVCLDSNSNSERLYYISCIFSISLLIYYLIITFLFWFWWKNEDKTWTNPYWIIQHQDSTNENFRSLRFSVWISANYYYPILWHFVGTGHNTILDKFMYSTLPTNYLRVWIVLRVLILKYIHTDIHTLKIFPSLPTWMYQQF